MSIKDFTTTQVEDQSSKYQIQQTGDNLAPDWKRFTELVKRSCCPESNPVVYQFGDNEARMYCPYCGHLYKLAVGEPDCDLFLSGEYFIPPVGSVWDFYLLIAWLHDSQE